MEVNYTVYLYKNQPNQGTYTTVKPQKRPLGFIFLSKATNEFLNRICVLRDVTYCGINFF